jgi:YHS domain-containing protein
MKPLKIIVVGTLASDPYAGMAWMHMQIVVGLLRLGHNAYYFETTSTWPYNPVIESRVDNTEYSIPYLKKIAEDFGIADRWAYRCSFSKNKEWYGLSKAKAEDLLANADLVFNISGSTRFQEEGLKVNRLVYFGTDPVYHEIKYAEGDENTSTIINEHHDMVTYGENIGNPDCPIPPLPRLRAKTRQPVLTDMWKKGEPAKREFTTVGNWKQAGRDLDYNGETYYWSKHHEFLKFIDVPKRVSQPIEVAMNLSGLQTINHGIGTEIPSLGVAVDEYTLLTSNGWQLIDAPGFTTNPWPYREYILNSRGEFSFAKDQNIRLRSGWFSERSACYLAAGRPVITQDTGFGNALPTGEGLFSFNTMEEIEAAFDLINSDYKKHSKAAMNIAEEYFRAETVLEKLLTDLSA